jgi:two-component system OmpR family response regulator
MHRRILIIDDDPAVHDVVRPSLEAAGHTVESAFDGARGLRLSAAGAPALIVLELRLADMAGEAVLGEVRRRSAVPILVLSVADRVADRVRGLDLGADDYMVKPFAMPELTARVRALLRRSQAHGGPRIAHGPLQLDTVASRAFLRNEPLELAAREWAVLEVLLARVEKIVSKEAIIQAVAGWGDDLSPNAIEVYVSRLRSKLEPAGIKIRTVRGFGYMLEEFK